MGLMTHGLLETMQERLNSLTARVEALEKAPAATAPAPAEPPAPGIEAIFGHGQTQPDNLPPDPSAIEEAQGFTKEE